MISFRKNILIFAALFLYLLLIFRPFFFEGKLPIPADTIVGLYHPWRDSLGAQYPSGVPFKNFLITDSVRQQFPWRSLSIEKLKKSEIPRWNPYSFSGYPLLANMQSAAFYPLNLLFLLPLKFSTIWSWQVILQTLLGGIFMAVYLRNLRLSPVAVTIGMLSWVGGGFFTAWLLWNTTIQVAIWLPLILLAIDKIILTNSNRRQLLWSVIFVLALSSSFLAGYLQPFFYVFVLSAAYIAARIFQQKKYRLTQLFLGLYLLFFLMISPQLLATVKLILLSARDVDQANWTRADWFLPWQNLIQFLAPDYFGNPATLNYFGVWNYQEFVGYIGIPGLILALLALLVRHDRKVLFFFSILIVSLIFSTQNFIASLPFIFKIPFLSTSQPSRLMIIIDFTAAVLVALGSDHLYRQKLGYRKILLAILPTAIAFAAITLFAWKMDLSISLRNLVLPIILFILTATLLLISLRQFLKKFAIILVLLLLVFDLSRFFSKYTPFSNQSWLYPSTKITSFLQQDSKKDVFRVAALDDRIFPPNFSIQYKIQMISGYDPLYLRRYGELITAIERGKPDISEPYGFNRIIVPKNYQNKLFPLLNVKYFLSFDPLTDPKYKLVLTEGKTNLYQNTSLIPRAYFATQVWSVNGKNDAINKMYSPDFIIGKSAVVESMKRQKGFSSGIVNFLSYSENTIILETQNKSEGFLVLHDIFYPDWKVTIDNRGATIYLTNYTFRGVIIPPGNHIVKFKI